MFKRVLSKYLLIWLCFTCVFAFYWPKLFGENAWNPFLQNANFMSALISVTMLAVGSLLPFEEVKQVARRWPKTLGGTCVQYVAMPTLAFLVAKLFHLEGPAFVGAMMAGCVPGAMASNVLTLTARGNVSYSVGLTTSATLLSPLVVPATLWFFLRQSVHLDVASIMTTLLLTVVAPVLLGFTLSRLFRFWQKSAEALAEIIANVAIIWIIAAVVAKNANSLSSVTPALLGAMILLNLGGYLAGYFGGAAIGLDAGMRRALTIEVGKQNAGLGTTLAMTYFPDMPEAALFCASYTFGCMFTGILLAQGFRFFADRNAAKTDGENVEKIKTEPTSQYLKNTEQSREKSAN